MNRRTFLSNAAYTAGALLLPPPGFRTKHLIYIANAGGVRKREYYQDTFLAPNIRRLASEGFVFEEDHCERVASHKAAFAELLQGREVSEKAAPYPTILDYIGDGCLLDSIRKIPHIMQMRRPRVIVCREMAHDVAHESYEAYLRTVKETDDSIGSVFDWIKGQPYFSGNTAIVIRPEFGRDDQVNEHGHLHHSYGFYDTHRVASIFWGPDFDRGVDRTTLIQAQDMAPTLTKLFGIDASYAQGSVVPRLFKNQPGSKTI